MRFCTTLCISSVRRLGITLVGCTRRVDVEVQADVAGVVGGPGVDEVAAEEHGVVDGKIALAHLLGYVHSRIEYRSCTV